MSVEPVIPRSERILWFVSRHGATWAAPDGYQLHPLKRVLLGAFARENFNARKTIR